MKTIVIILMLMIFYFLLYIVIVAVCIFYVDSMVEPEIARTLELGVYIECNGFERYLLPFVFFSFSPFGFVGYIEIPAFIFYACKSSIIYHSTHTHTTGPSLLQFKPLPLPPPLFAKFNSFTRRTKYVTTKNERQLLKAKKLFVNHNQPTLTESSKHFVYIHVYFEIYVIHSSNERTCCILLSQVLK